MVEKTEQKSGFSKYMGLTFLIGFGFFTMGLMDPLYDTYIPIFLRRYVDSNFLVGGIMTLDNILQLLLIPLIAVWSDRTRTKIGRRMPFIIVMLPIAAVLFSLFPKMATLWSLVILIFLFNMFKTSVRGPVVALMPDTVPADYRSEANGVINMMGGIGLIVGTLVLAPLGGENRQQIPFFAASICIVTAVLILFVFVKEKIPENPEASAEKKIPVFASVKQVFSGKDRSAVRILISLFFWFMAYEGAKPFLGLYMVESLGVAQNNAALAQGIAGVSSVIVAVFTGYFAHKMGRRNYIRLCLLALAAIMLLIFGSGFLAQNLGFSSMGGLVLFLALMFIYGAFWIGIVVNSFPMLWQMTSYETVGVYTGLYYLFSQSAAILAPPITGGIIDLAGYPGIFIFGALCMIIAWFVMRGVSSGEAVSK
ncbi:MAG: MFS transporter [Treponema sp.]|jgi:MFS family permease|nr:MFS transporter [Treponema sp.]